MKNHFVMYSLYLWLSLPFCLQAQPWDFGNGFGGTAGISATFGTHVSRIGFTTKFYYTHPYFQINLNLSGWYNGETLGSQKPAWEGVVKLGAVGCWGKRRDTLISPFINELSNQNDKLYNAGYSYNFYFNNIGTTQFTGCIGFRAWGFRFVMENDFLAFQSQDKYRSGTVAVFYRHRNTQAGLYIMGWTGDPYKGADWVKDDKLFPARYGYINMEGAPYGDRSAGILAAVVEHYLPIGGQYIDAHIGVDAEQVRNAFQNKFIHENFILRNPHIPMLCVDGKPYLYRAGQKIRRPLFFMQLGWNNNTWW